MIFATGGTTAAAYQALLRAAKAMGPIAQIEKAEFQQLLHKAEKPVVIVSTTGIFKKKNQYFMPYRGLYLYCETTDTLEMPGSTDVIEAKSLWIPKS